MGSMRYLKVDEAQYQTLDKQYILSQKEGSRSDIELLTESETVLSGKLSEGRGGKGND